MFMQRTLFTVAALSLFAMAGCESSTTPTATTLPTASIPTTSQQAIMVRGNSGTTVAFFLPSDNPDKPMALMGPGVEVCPECEAAAIKYFKTGVLDPECSRTGATRTLVGFTPTTTGHQ
jgi:hypothetical protein